VQLTVNVQERIAFSVTVTAACPDAATVDATAATLREKELHILDLEQEVCDLQELYGDVHQVCSTATAEAAQWRAQCGQLQEQLSAAQGALEACQQQNFASQTQLKWSAVQHMQQMQAYWVGKHDELVQQCQQLEKACQDHERTVGYYRRGLERDSWLAMQGDGREQLARLNAAEQLLQQYTHFWALKSSSLLRLWVQHPDLTLQQLDGMFKRMALLVHTDKLHGPSMGEDEDMKALNSIRDLIRGYEKGV
jgi:hypothetical protein